MKLRAILFQEGEFAILRDVIVVRAYSEVADDGWDTVINHELITDIQIIGASVDVASERYDCDQDTFRVY